METMLYMLVKLFTQQNMLKRRSLMNAVSSKRRRRLKRFLKTKLRRFKKGSKLKKLQMQQSKPIPQILHLIQQLLLRMISSTMYESSLSNLLSLRTRKIWVWSKCKLTNLWSIQWSSTLCDEAITLLIVSILHKDWLFFKDLTWRSKN